MLTTSETNALPASHSSMSQSHQSEMLPVSITRIPPRPRDAISGSEFARKTAALSDSDRQKAALVELERGNVPDFMRKFYPLSISMGSTSNARVKAVIWVSPDYLSIGNNNDFLRFPLAYFPATTIARLFGCILPTPKIVDTVYHNAQIRLTPQPLKAGPQMRSCGYCVRHEKIVDTQLEGVPIDGIIAGHKKDVVLTNRLWSNPGRIAIYGWHRNDDSPIQPLSTVHGENYADYSHGIRLIRDSVWIQGETRSIYDLLQDREKALLFTYEGVMQNPIAMMQPAPSSKVWLSALRNDRLAAAKP